MISNRLNSRVGLTDKPPLQAFLENEASQDGLWEEQDRAQKLLQVMLGTCDGKRIGARLAMVGATD